MGVWRRILVFRGQQGHFTHHTRSTPQHLFQTLFSGSKKGLKHEALESVFGSQNGAKIEPVSKKHRPQIVIDTEHRFSLILGHLGSRKWKPRTQLFLQKAFVLLYESETAFFLTRGGFEINFGTHLASFWHHFGRNVREKSEKIEPETASKNNCYFY